MATIEQKVTATQDLVVNLTATVAELVKAVAAIPTQPGSTPADNSAILAALAPIAAGIADIQAQVEEPAAPAPAPAPVDQPTA